MTVPQEVRLARHALDLDDDGHDTHLSGSTVTLVSGALSSPPTQAELQALIGSVGAGRLFLVTNTTTGFRYSAVSDGIRFEIVPTVLPAGTPTVTSDVFAMTTAPEGGWTQIQAPKAVGYNGYTYIGWHNGSTGATRVGVWNNATRVKENMVTVHGAFGGGVDNHDAPSILLDSVSHRVIVAYSEHGDATIRRKRSVNSLDTDPTLSGGFGSEYAAAFAGNYTYQNLVQLDSGTIFWLYRYISGSTGYLEWVKSTDGGATWSGPTQIFGSTSGHVAYWRIGTDGTKIHVVTTETEPTASSTFHFYMLEDGSLHKSDGTTLGSFIHSTDCTPVLAFGAGGANWAWGVADDGLGPAAVLMQDIGGDNRIVTARYRSGSWVIDEVVASVGGQVTGNQYASGAGIVPTDPNRVAYAKLDGSHWEQFRSVSPDDGASWTEEQLTFGSSVDQLWADAVHDAETDGPEFVWLSGTYTSDTVFSFGITGALP